MTDGSSQGLFVVLGIIIFGIFVAISYTLFRDQLTPSLANVFSYSSGNVINILENKKGTDLILNDFAYQTWIKKLELEGYMLLSDNDFYGEKDGQFIYIGEHEKVIVPKVIKGIDITSTNQMFSRTSVTSVALNNPKIVSMVSMFYVSLSPELDLSNLNTSNVSNMQTMFQSSQALSIDLSNFDTSNVTNMDSMFRNIKVITLDLSNFNTSNVEHMNSLFYGSQVKTLDLSNFNTSNVTDMNSMFYESHATTLDLSSFDTSKVTNTWNMFYGSKATTGYARNQEEATKFNNIPDKPSALTFVLK